MNKLATVYQTRGWPFGLTRSNSLLSSFFDDVLYPSVNWEYNDNALTLSLEIPGFKQSEVSVEVRNGFIVIKAKNDKQSLSESFSINSDIDIDKIEAKLENGILTLTLPKVSESTTSKKIEIKS